VPGAAERRSTLDATPSEENGCRALPACLSPMTASRVPSPEALPLSLSAHRISPMTVLKDADDHSVYRARAYEYRHLMTDSPEVLPYRFAGVKRDDHGPGGRRSRGPGRAPIHLHFLLGHCATP
jgi:hypothetical protein